jgi:hypothetical protein
MPVLVFVGVAGRVCVCVSFVGFYLHDSDAEERAAEAYGDGGGGHDGRAGQEPHHHGERRHLVPARDDPRLQRHEQTCISERALSVAMFTVPLALVQESRVEHGPRLNMAMPRPASERIEMDLRMIAGISKFHLQAETEYRVGK